MNSSDATSTKKPDLKQLVLKSHVVLRLETNTSTEDVSQGTTLLGKSINDWGSRWGQWSLEHVAENAQHAVEVLEILGGDAISGMGLPLNTSHHLCDHNQINYQWGCKQRVLANVEESGKLVCKSTRSKMGETYEMV